MKKLRAAIGQIVDKIKYEQYLFLQFLVWVSVPMLVMIAIIYHIYVTGEQEKSEILLDAYASQVEESFSGYFTDVREYYLDICNSSEYIGFLKEKAPLGKVEELTALKKRLSGERIGNRVSSYCFVNLRYEWVLCNYGLYRFDQLKNREMLEGFLAEIQNADSNILWLEREAAGEESEALKKYGRLELSGKLLVIKSENVLLEPEGVLILGLKLGDLEENLKGYEELGYEVLAEGNGDYFIGKEKEEEIEAHTERYLFRQYRDDANSLTYSILYDTGRNEEQAFRMLKWAVLFLLAYAGILVILRKVTAKVSEPFWILQTNNEEQKKKIREFLVINILKGLRDEKIVQYGMEQYGWEKEKGYRLLMVKEGSGQEGEEIPKECLEEIAGQVFLQPVKYRGCLAILVGDEDEMKTDYRAAFVYQQLARYEEAREKQLVVGVSGYFTDLKAGQRAVEQCLEAMTKRGQGHEGSLLVLYDDFKLQAEEREEKKEEKDLLKEAIRENKKEQARRILHEMIYSPRMDSVWGIEWTVWVQRLVMSILTAAEASGIEIKDIFREKEELSVFREQIYDREKLEQAIVEEVLEPVLQAMNGVEISRNEAIVKEVEKLIHEREGYITLTECAELLALNPSYLSRVIKKERQKGFLDLVNEEKAARACHMLAHSKASVAEIAEKLGYNNTQNFIRFFKNQRGITPARYRKEAWEENART